MIEVLLLSPWQIEPIWGAVEGWVQDALDVAGGWNSHHVKAWLKDGACDLWLVKRSNSPEACAVTELGSFPRCKVLNVQLVGGSDLDAWIDPLFSTLEAHARSLGCARLMCSYARRGWIRALKPHGWTPRATVIAKDLIA